MRKFLVDVNDYCEKNKTKAKHTRENIYHPTESDDSGVGADIAIAIFSSVVGVGAIGGVVYYIKHNSGKGSNVNLRSSTYTQGNNDYNNNYNNDNNSSHHNSVSVESNNASVNKVSVDSNKSAVI